ncbi:MAG TPA: hypothetical protein VGI81_21070 [Tepidisphaeraceae bacterium]
MRLSPTIVFAALIVTVLNAAALADANASALTAADEVTIEGEVATLRQAYVYLEAGNHDYHGHRVKALRAVGAACHVLGFPAKKDARNHEDQKFSDNLLGSARSLLVNILPHAQAKHQGDVVDHLNNAIREIDLAISGDKGPPPKSPPHSSSK